MKPNPHGTAGPIGLAGAGRIAQSLGRLLREAGEPLVCVASRHPEHARAAAAFIGDGVAPLGYDELPAYAGRVVVAVPDHALDHVVAALAGGSFSTALHTCGSRGPDALAPLAAGGTSCGTVHPLQTVPDPAEGLVRLRGIAWAVWGDEPAVRWAEQIACLLGGFLLRIAPEQRPLYHAAAVMASNYVTGLVDAAQRLLEAAGVPSGDALRALAPLVEAAAANAVRRGPVEALTGPVERGDAATVRGHLEALAATPGTILPLYRAAGLQVLDIACRRGLASGPARELEQILRGN